MKRFKARRGAFVVLTAVLMTSMVALCALSIDFARLATLKTELQTSADAAAMAGGIQLLPKHAALVNNAPDSARAYANRNKAMQDTVRVDSVLRGTFSPSTWVFTPGPAPHNSIRVVVSRQARGLFIQGMGVTLPRVTAKATAWAGAPVTGDGCMKPWAIPYPLLMARINTYQGIANPTSPANLTRTFTTNDYNTLLSMPAASRQFDMHLGLGGALDSLGMAGNYQAVLLDQKRYDVKSGITISNPQPPAGFNKVQYYAATLSGSQCNPVNIGDQLETITGLSSSVWTVDPLVPSVCATLVTNKNAANFGDCRDASGNAPTIVAMYYLCSSGCSGLSYVTVMLIGAFTIDKIYDKNDPPNNIGMGEIKGTFAAYASAGPISYTGGASPVVKVVLVH